MVSGQQFHSLGDFLASMMADVDGVLDDGFGEGFPVKGREIEATVLFADISSFSTRTLAMSPAATLIFVQNFFGWVTAEALRGRPGIVDKYIGDEMMVVFSTEFGSEDPFADAVQAGAAMSRRDVHAYRPHIGIASGPVIVGYAGTATQYNVSVFGAPVALAARCASVRPDAEAVVSSSIVIPATEWAGRDLDTVLPRTPDEEEFPLFELQPERDVAMKGLGEVGVREIYNTGMRRPSQSAGDRATAGLQFLRDNNRYWPRSS